MEAVSRGVFVAVVAWNRSRFLCHAGGWKGPKKTTRFQGQRQYLEDHPRTDVSG